MPKRLVGDRLETADFAFNSRINLHVHPATSTSTCLLFVHGLGGRGYDTWADLPALLFEERRDPLDVAVFDYKSGLRRGKQIHSQRDVDEVVRELAHEIRDLPYEQVILIGHSMGGLIAQSAVKQLHLENSGSHYSMSRVAGIILLATPRAGSLRPYTWIMLPDARFVRAHSRVVIELNDFFTNQVHIRCDTSSTTFLRIPVFAAAATDDKYVDRFSALVGIPSDQTKQFAGGHSEFIKVVRSREGDTSDALLDWINGSLDRILALRLLRGQTADAEASQVVAQFSGHASQPNWEHIYLTALEQVDREQDVSVADVRQLQGRVNLILRALPSSELGRSETITLLREDADRQEQDPRTSMCVAVWGASQAEALAFLRRTLGETPAGISRYVVGVSSEQELLDTLVEWLMLECSRTRRSGAYRNRLDVGRELLVNQGANLLDRHASQIRTDQEVW